MEFLEIGGSAKWFEGHDVFASSCIRAQTVVPKGRCCQNGDKEHEDEDPDENGLFT